jgi:hypothetical protein
LAVGRILSDADIVELYLSGLDAMSVGLRANCDANTVLKLVRKAGGLVRRRGGVKPRLPLKLSIPEILKLYDSGLAVQDVADQAGAGREAVRRLLIQNGVRLRTSKDYALAARLRRQQR